MTSRQYESADMQLWTDAERIYAVERAVREVNYLRQVLEEIAPGKRVVDMACGSGLRAIGLAKAGFEVTALETSERAVNEARMRADRAGVDVRWELFDPSGLSAWPFDSADAAIYLPRVVSGAGASQRLLRRIRHRLVNDGVLVAGQSASQPSPASPSSVEPESSLDRDIPILSPAELISLVKSAGFAVERVDAEITAGRSMTEGSSTAHVIGRCLPAPPDSLAVTSWRNPTDVLLDLRYAPDEAELLDPPPSEIWKDFMLSTSDSGVELIGNYPVDDPFGSERGLEAVSRYFDCPIRPQQLTFAAGVTSLLHDMCGLADGGTILAPELTHGDLEAWALVRGIEARPLDEPAIWDRLVTEVEAAPPALLHFDRPTFTGHVIGPDELKALLRAASRAGTVVLIDESPAPYLGPLESAARLVNEADNLVVLRGFTKAYSWGGLRAGFAVASDGVAGHVRELVTPMQIGELALNAALRLLAAGDVFARLRARIHRVKPRVIEILRARHFDVLDGHEDLPWVALSDSGGVASKRLSKCGICALHPVCAPVLPRRKAEVLRLTVPLSQQRMALFSELLEAESTF